MVTVKARTIDEAYHMLLRKFLEKKFVYICSVCKKERIMWYNLISEKIMCQDHSENNSRITPKEMELISEEYINTYVTNIDSGSFQGQQRIQADIATVIITEPWTRPLAPTIRQGIPAPTDEEKIEKYFVKYVAGSEIGKNERYTYGSRMHKHPSVYRSVEDKAVYFDQVKWCVGHFKDKPGNNHCCIQIPVGTDLLSDHSPCLRSVDLKIENGSLNMTLYFRSWDLIAGLPENLGGFQLFNELLAQEIGVKPGKLIGVSSGLHIYSMHLDIALARLGV